MLCYVQVAAEACKLVAYIICRAIESEVTATYCDPTTAQLDVQDDHTADAAGFLDQVTADYIAMTAEQQGGHLSGIHEVCVCVCVCDRV